MRKKQRIYFWCAASWLFKMAPSMAAVLRAPRKLCSFSYVLFVILLFYVLDVVSITVYDRDTLLNIGSFVAQRKPDFEFLNAGALFTDTASEPFVWIARSRTRKRRRKRGKRAGVLVRLRLRPLRPPLPTILLANVQSLDNKLCELRARISYQRETRDCCIICLTETWMSAVVPDSAIELTGFSVHRRTERKSSQGKAEVGAFVSLSTTRGVMKGIYTLLNPSAPLIWNFICFCVDHSGYRGNLHLSANRIILPFCSCLLIGRNWNEKHPPSGQFNAGRTNRTLYCRTVLITWTGTCSWQRLMTT